MRIEEAIKKRRSIRRFKDRGVSSLLINKLITAAQLAPSAYNGQPSKFIIVEDKRTKQKFRENNIFKQDFVYQAPVIIICCADPGVYPQEKFNPTYSNAADIGGEIGAVRDLSISTQNLVLMATGLGLGTCYIGLIDRSKTKEIFSIPQNYVIPFAVIVGHPDETPTSTPRKKLAELIITKNIIK